MRFHTSQTTVFRTWSYFLPDLTKFYFFKLPNSENVSSPIAFASFETLRILCIKDNSYEVRRYAAAEWVSTLVQESTEEKAMKVAFKRLVEYAQGANDKGTKRKPREILKVIYR